jgi:hypothetical protein
VYNEYETHINNFSDVVPNEHDKRVCSVCLRIRKGRMPGPLLAAQTEEKKVITDNAGNLTLIDEDTREKADALAGTCPKGFHCSCPGCPLWSDLDEDNFCDHGEEPEELDEE